MADEQNRYRQSRFLFSAASLKQLPPDEGYEVAFAGRSNAGKSTALNTICDIGGLARVSKQPGRTQLINFFGVSEERRLVDLPGYGYAKVPLAVREQWKDLVEGYVETRNVLRGLIVIMDVRHPLMENDRQMLLWCREVGKPAHILLSKADKLGTGAAKATLLKVNRELGELAPGATVQLFSGLKKQGVDEARAVLDRWFCY